MEGFLVGPNSGLSKLVQSITFKGHFCIVFFFQIMPQFSTEVPQGHHMRLLAKFYYSPQSKVIIS